MYTLGATSKTIHYIFIIEGLLIALSGAIVGMVVAWAITWLQQRFGIISLGAETSLVDAYPIKRKVSDFVYIAMSIIGMTWIAAYYPARIATKFRIRLHL